MSIELDGNQQAVLQVVNQHPEGVSLEQIGAIFAGQASTKTLQRIVTSLITAGRVTSVGQSTSTRYVAVTAAAPAPRRILPPDPAVIAALTSPRRILPPDPIPAAPVPAPSADPIPSAEEQKQLVIELVGVIVQGRVPKVAARPYIRQSARGLPNAPQFIAAVEAALAGLNYDNLDEYGLDANAFELWQSSW